MSQQYSIEQGEPIEITLQGQQVAVILSTAEYKRLLNKYPGFWESLQQFRQEIISEGIEIDPDEVWKDVRDKSPGREVNISFTHRGDFRREIIS